MVTMTVFITDARYGTRLTELRREIFGDDFAGERAHHRDRPRPARAAGRDPGHRGRRLSACSISAAA